MSAWIDDLRAAVAADEQAAIGRGCTEADAAGIESALGVTLRGTYREFLLACGWADFAYNGIFGWDPGGENDLVPYVQSEWHPDLHGPRAPLLPFRPIGNGDHFCLDLTSSDAEPPVVWWSHEDAPDVDPYVEAGSFAAFIAQLIAERAT